MSNLAIRKISGRVLVVDDEPVNVQLLERMLGYAGCTDRYSTTDPRGALQLCLAVQPDAVLLDLNMPFIDGVTLLGQLNEHFPSRALMPIIVLTADSTTEMKHRALEAGASDYLTKPLDAVELVLRLGNLLECRALHLETIANNDLLETRVRERTRDLEEAQLELIDRLSVATEMRDDATGDHVERVATMTARIAEEMGIPAAEVEILRRAVRLHDIGKISVPDSILLKPGKLTEEEFDVVRRHAEDGGRILQGSRFPLIIRAEEIARHHHERWDGHGYPDQLKQQDIPLSARIAAVADVFDALTHARPYKEAWRPQTAAAEIQRQSGSQFDPRVVEAFQRVLRNDRDAQAESLTLREAA